MKTFNLWAVVVLGLFVFSCKQPVKQEKTDELKLSATRVDLTKLGERVLLDLNNKLYNALFEGKINAYRYDSITATSIFKPGELKKISTLEQIIQIGSDPGNPDYIIDSVVGTEFKPQDIAGYSVAVKWTYDLKKGSVQCELYSFAINWKPVFAGITIPESPLCWVSYADLSQLLRPEDKEEMNRIVFNSLKDTLSDY